MAESTWNALNGRAGRKPNHPLQSAQEFQFGAQPNKLPGAHGTTVQNDQTLNYAALRRFAMASPA
jgi:hypothetical protein